MLGGNRNSVIISFTTDNMNRDIVTTFRDYVNKGRFAKSRDYLTWNAMNKGIPTNTL
jgi:hypothetical protein